MQVVSWNVNSIRARAGRVEAWLRRHQPDIVLLQETKCTDQAFGRFAATYAELGYASSHLGHDQWNGVAILSRVGLDEVRFGFAGPIEPPFDEARLLSATCGGMRVVTAYAPNGRTLDDPHYEFKLAWLDRLRTEVDTSEPTFLAGDLNVAPTDADVYDPSRFRGKTHTSPPERAAIEALVERGLVDVTRTFHPGPDVYTWWSYRPGQFERNRGLRIDLALCSPAAEAAATDAWIDTEERAPRPTGEKPSDHAPLVVELDWPPAG